jgi:hypothetical protein
MDALLGMRVSDEAAEVLPAGMKHWDPHIKSKSTATAGTGLHTWVIKSNY